VAPAVRRSSMTYPHNRSAAMKSASQSVEMVFSLRHLKPPKRRPKISGYSSLLRQKQLHSAGLEESLVVAVVVTVGRYEQQSPSAIKPSDDRRDESIVEVESPNKSQRVGS
jgi:hypothetical protein